MHTIRGTDGNDRLHAGAGHDLLYGLGGSDIFIVDLPAHSWQSANWVMDFEQGRDRLNTGSDPVWYQKIDTTGDGAVDSTAVYHQASGRSSPSGSGDTPVIVVLKGFTGVLTGDDFEAGAGRPTTVTAIRQDFTGTDGADILTGNDGNNRLGGGAGHDVLTGGGGADVFVVDYGSYSWRTTNWVTDFKRQEHDKLYYGPHPLWYQQIDTTGDGAPDSTAIYNDAQGESRDAAKTVVAVLKGVTGALTRDDFEAGAGRPTTVTAIRQDFTGTDGADILTGNDGNNRLDGGAGHDVLTGGGGADVFVVDYGSYSWRTTNWVTDFRRNGDQDKLHYLQHGNDSLWYQQIDATGDGALDSTAVYTGARGESVTMFFHPELAGGSFSTPFLADSTDWNVVAVLKGFTGDLTRDDFVSDGRPGRLEPIRQNLTGTSGDDALTGGDGNNVLRGLGGNDRLAGMWGADRLDGGGGVDTADYSASNAGVRIDLSNGAGSGGHARGDRLTNIENVTGSLYGDTLTGDGGANVLEGGRGADVLGGGAGRDTLTGGAGSDRFLVEDVSTRLSSADRITDFAGSGGERDTLFIGRTTGSVWYEHEDADGDGDADTVIYADAGRAGVHAVLEDYTGTLDAGHFADAAGNATTLGVIEIL